MRRALLAAAALGLLSTAGLAGASAQRASFANGTWTGTARLTQTYQGITVVASSTFTMKVTAGRVTGTLVSKATASGTTSGQRVTAVLKGRAPLRGTAAKPVARGKVTLTATIQGKRESASAKVVNTFVRLRGTCSRMTGRIVVTSAEPQSSGSGPTSASAPFVATRKPGSGPAC